MTGLTGKWPALERIHLDDTIHEQERVPVGQVLHDLLNVHDDFAHIVNLLLLFSSSDGAAGNVWKFRFYRLFGCLSLPLWRDSLSGISDSCLSPARRMQ